MTEKKDRLKRKLRKHTNGNFNNILVGSAGKKKIKVLL
jgi:hypothetical protein